MPCVLLVEDHGSTRRICSQALRGRGYDVIEMQSGRRALSLAHLSVVDVVVLDWGLPDMTGEEFLERLARRNAPAPVILYSNQSHLCAHAACRPGVFALVAKAEDLTELLETVAAACRLRAVPHLTATQARRVDPPTIPATAVNIRCTETPTC